LLLILLCFLFEDTDKAVTETSTKGPLLLDNPLATTMDNILSPGLFDCFDSFPNIPNVAPESSELGKGAVDASSMSINWEMLSEFADLISLVGYAHTYIRSCVGTGSFVKKNAVLFLRY